jgi:hypothetical protein
VQQTILLSLGNFDFGLNNGITKWKTQSTIISTQLHSECCDYWNCWPKKNINISRKIQIWYRSTLINISTSIDWLIDW